jgi:large subunit ribosomal protein L23
VSLTAHDIVIHPVISEKSMDEAQRGKYTFAVHRNANKVQIAAAVAELFKVEVLGVNVLTTQSKEKRGGMRRSRVGGRTTAWRKAIVTLAPGQKIEFFEAV